MPHNLTLHECHAGKMCEQTKKQKIKDVLTEVFRDIDKDKSGFLDHAELEHVIKEFLQHPDCPAECKAEHGSPEKIKGLCEVRNCMKCHLSQIK